MESKPAGELSPMLVLDTRGLHETDRESTTLHRGNIPSTHVVRWLESVWIHHQLLSPVRKMLTHLIAYHWLKIPLLRPMMSDLRSILKGRDPYLAMGSETQ
jgi:hypothetical protein